MSEKEICPCCARKKERTPEEHRSLQNRLSRIEGQIRGLRNMIDNDAYCIDVLTQACAAKSALEAFMREMIASHMKTCVAHDLREGDDSSIDELIIAYLRFLKSDKKQ